ncbi:uncharacterized protein LOC131207527 [Anopheles bellator]|uniref:uncharacterized protein LOC131207527 n=1 Tax=Anopheles bellator TaxID=139047 RepID=UPI0026481F58|nr:uncharacterized protein LOC131207527 [Anopheles bellator]
MKRNLNIHQLRRLRQSTNCPNDNPTDELQASSDLVPSKKRIKKHDVQRNGVRTRPSEEPRRPEEITAMLMQAIGKPELCWDFDLQHWLTQYMMLRQNPNFPEAALLLTFAAEIYSRKIEYLNDIINHICHDQKARETKEKAARGEENAEPSGSTTQAKGGRKRVGRFNPATLSDCFSELEFTCNDRKLAQLEALIQAPQTVEVDRRSTVQQMQDLCNEFRTNPPSQRRQAILNRLRDAACIAPIMSSHGTARRSQILDLESSETIGTRHDYQIYQNFIDGRSGSLVAEHDLKRFFQRCDVIDFLHEQHESERERCLGLGKPAPVSPLPLMPRECKIYIPPEYLRNNYRINMPDTTDFDKALLEARITNYRADPILFLMGPEDKERQHKLASYEGEPQDSALCSPVPPENLQISSESGLGASIMNDTNGSTFLPIMESTNILDSTVGSTSDNPFDSELQALEKGTSTAQGSFGDEQTLEESGKTAQPSRLSVDEGIGADRDSPPRSQLQSPIAVPLMLGGGIVVERSTTLRPVLLSLNLFGLPEARIKKRTIFSLPDEYRQMKNDVKKRVGDRTKDVFTLNVYSLHPDAAQESPRAKRPSTPELEDFCGFEDVPVIGEVQKMRAKKMAGERRISQSNGSDFLGFDDKEVDAARSSVSQWFAQCPPETLKLLESPKRTSPKKSTISSSPNRSMSCDSGISDTVDRSQREPEPSAFEPITEAENDVECSGEDLSISQSLPAALTSGAVLNRMQRNMDEAKECMEKVNEWHRKLKPVLLESEKRNHFDIHEYGTEIIGTFDANASATSGAITLGQVLNNKPPHSTARYFLSTLMLANTQNIRVVNHNPDRTRVSETEEMELRLLSRQRHHEQLGETLPGNSNTSASRSEHVKKQNRKRKNVFEVIKEDRPAEEVLRPDPSVRLSHDSSDFLVRMAQMDEVHCAATVRKRMEFRHGMRNHAYSLAENDGAGPSSSHRQPPSEIITSTPEPEEDILMIDVHTNRTRLILMSVSDLNTSCGKSVHSLDSGYQSTIGR